ncbi:MAG TPA: HAD-IIB family hydrolase [Campylobacterales bacterium]|nr:HAD-IIB family hydrolase [Campylobacterales bacterium]
MKSILFTDLDGTFLNHHDYRFDASHEALARIKELQIPLIFTTSKTKAEVERLQQQVGICEPFIVENGAALFIPQGYQNFLLSELQSYEDKKVLIFGETYDKILEFYRLYRDEFGMRGFSDMSESEVGEYTGLSATDALLSKQREFTEPFILSDESKIDELQRLAQCYELKITKGGRFYHLMGETQDKGIAVMDTVALFEKLYGQKVRSIALGDSDNDLPMLEGVDVPILIQKPNGSYLETNLPKIQKSSYPGCQGWNEMVLKNV